ncbi:hypothetical protein N7470_007003 [Penicillium chermesinum]|nr:hypothetical protein N7470_007003 [Penicillium chermesinum]
MVGFHAADASIPNLDNLPNGIQMAFESVLETLIFVYYFIYTEDSIRSLLEIYKTKMFHNPDKYRNGGEVTAVWMRLDDDIEVYRFIKSWYLFEQREPPLSWPPSFSRHCVLPPHVNSPNVFEPVDFYLAIETRFPNQEDHIQFLLSLTLLKIKLVLDLRNLQRAIEWAGPKVPGEVLELILKEELDAQVDGLYCKVHEANRYWWKLLVAKPWNAVEALVEQYSQNNALAKAGSPAEACAWFLKQQFCWIETPAALEYVEGKNKGSSFPSMKETERVYGHLGEQIHPFCTADGEGDEWEDVEDSDE